MSRVMEGGCFCGFVRYRTQGAATHETLCHCSICRRTSGAPCVAWFTVASDEFQILRGDPASFASSEYGTRSFCPRCGTPLSFRTSRLPNEVDVTTASLDAPEALPPRDHTRTSRRLSWMQKLDELPTFAEEREEEKTP